ncbi:MAG: GAF domain-containing protein [Acidobacteriota bacterium]
MEYVESLKIFATIGQAFNEPVDTVELLERTARAVVEGFALKGCHFRLLSRDQRVLEHVASWGLSRAFLDKGPVDAERSVAEALEGRTVLVSNCLEDPRIQYPQAFADEGVASLLTVPLTSRGQVIGVMRLFNGASAGFSDEDLGVLDVVASFCASAVVHSMFHDILANVTTSIRDSLELDQVLDSIVCVIAESVRAKGCTIMLTEGRGAEPRLRAVNGIDEDIADSLVTTPCPAMDEALAGNQVAILDIAGDPRTPDSERFQREGVSSMLNTPLAIRDDVIGVLSLFTHKPYHFSDDELHLMRAIAEQCALAVRNAQMYAAVKQRYDSVVNDFQQWFDHYHGHGMPVKKATG